MNFYQPVVITAAQDHSLETPKSKNKLLFYSMAPGVGIMALKGHGPLVMGKSLVVIRSWLRFHRSQPFECHDPNQQIQNIGITKECKR
ncbi:MAG: hypothetical protein ABI642_05125 [Polaromonas sp.]